MMNRPAIAALLLSIALVCSGCKTAPQPQSAQSGSSNSRSANDDDYNRRYQSEAQHHHRHGKRDKASSDPWSSYERAEPADESSAGSDAGTYRPRSDVAAGASRHDEPATRLGTHHNAHARTAAPGQFDFYVLNLSWSPEFCQGHPTAAECAQHRAFTLHGLWPQNNDGTYPEDCSEAPGPANPSQYADIYPDPSLLQHEWQTHGTCSGLQPDPFFTLARSAEQSVQIPSQLSHMTEQATMSPAQLITLFTQSNATIPASSLAITCGNNYLTAVEVCLDKTLRPESCSAVKTCGATQIRIPAPQ